MILPFVVRGASASDRLEERQPEPILAVDPPILLMDEPFGALDPVTRAEVRDEFTRLKKRLRTTVLVVTHDIAEAFALGDRVGVLDAGELIALDTPPQVAASTDRRVRALIDALPPVRPSDVR